MKNAKSPQFRYVYANGFSMQFNGNEFMLGFGIKEDVKADDILEEVGVVMLPATAKLLSELLSRTISAIEASGGPIPIDAERIDKIDRALRESVDEAARQMASEPPKPAES